MTRSQSKGRVRGVFLALGLCLQGQQGAADEPGFATPPPMVGSFAGAAEQAAAIERVMDRAGPGRGQLWEFVTRQRPSGGIALQAMTADVGSFARVTVSASGADGTQTSLSIQTLSPLGAENATTVHAVTIRPEGPLLAAATTGAAPSLAGQEAGDGAAAFAMIAGPEGAVFQASGNLSDLQLLPRNEARRRVRMDAPFYGWNLSGQGGAVLAAFFRPLHGRVAESHEQGFDIDLPETVPQSRLPAITLAQVHSLQAASTGLQAGIGLTRQMEDGIALWSRVGLGVTRVRARSHLLHLAKVDQAMVSGIEPTGSVARTIPSAMVSIGITQSFGTDHSVSLFVTAEADRTPVLAFADGGNAQIGFASTRTMSIGFSVDWRF